MNTAQTKIFVTLFAISAAFSGCASTPRNAQESQATSKQARHPAADESAIIKVFTEALAKESGLGSRADVENALNQLVKDNSEKLSSDHPISSLDDISSLDAADQKKILNELVRLPGFADRLATNSDVVRSARIEALASLQQTKAPVTTGVADLRAGVREGVKSDGPFATILERSPELEADVKLMITEDQFIEQKTGTRVLGKGCSNLQDPQSAKNIATMIEGVDRKVASGEVKDAQGVSKSLRQEMGDTLGTKPEESDRRICVLSKPEGCAVFSESMCK